jgi:hypothetical protein
MLLNRIKPSLEEILRNNKNGFRPGCSTTSHFLALRRITEGTKAKNLKATMVFIDFKKALNVNSIITINSKINVNLIKCT